MRNVQRFENIRILIFTTIGVIILITAIFTEIKSSKRFKERLEEEERIESLKVEFSSAGKRQEIISVKSTTETEGDIQGSGGFIIFYVRGSVKENQYFLILVKDESGVHYYEKVPIKDFRWKVNTSLEVAYREEIIKGKMLDGEIIESRIVGFMYYLPVEPKMVYETEFD